MVRYEVVEVRWVVRVVHVVKVGVVSEDIAFCEAVLVPVVSEIDSVMVDVVSVPVVIVSIVAPVTVVPISVPVEGLIADVTVIDSVVTILVDWHTVVSVMTPSVVVRVVSPSVSIAMLAIAVVSVVPSVLGIGIPSVSVVVWHVDIMDWSVVTWSVWVNDSVVWGLLLLSWLCGWLSILLWRFSSVGMVGVAVGWESVVWNTVGHLLSKEDLGEGEAERVTELIVVLVLPLGHGVHDFVVNILSVDDEVVVNVEDEVPWVGESLGHRSQLVKVGSDGGLALLELASDVVDNGTEVLDGVKDAVESGVSELINDTADSLPDVLGIAEALNTVWDFGLN